jgi:hypothetical protein
MTYLSAPAARKQIMPQIDHTDPEITFPRLEVRIQQIDADAYWLQIWSATCTGERQARWVVARCPGEVKPRKTVQVR